MSEHRPGRHRRREHGRAETRPSRGRRARRYVAIRLGLVVLIGIAVVAFRTYGLPVELPTGDNDLAAAAAGLDDGDGFREVHLTFDDGPTLDATNKILDLLAEHDAQATFFPVGEQVADSAAVLRRAVADGHAIGNHTWRHDRLAGISAADFDASVLRTQQVIRDVAGVSPTCLRPPGGVIDAATREIAVEAGMSIQMWTIDPQDWRSPGSDAIATAVLENISGTGDIVLLHDGGGDRGQTVDALEAILDALSDHGYRITAIPGC